MPAWVFGSPRGYRRAWLRRDLVAGLTVWAVLIPESLAYASIAGVSPVVGPRSATAALSAGVVGGIVANGSEEFPACGDLTRRR